MFEASILKTSIATLAFVVMLPSAASCASVQAVAGSRELAHPRVKGAAGPYRRTTLTLTRPAGKATSRFMGVLDVGGGKRLALDGPDEPDDFFYLDVKAVVFTPIDRSRANGIVVLYNSSKIGPGNGTDQRALIYRVEADRAVRQPAIEERLEGVKNAAEARAKLARVRS